MIFSPKCPIQCKFCGPLSPSDLCFLFVNISVYVLILQKAQFSANFVGPSLPVVCIFVFFSSIFFVFSFFCRKLNSVQTLPVLLLQWSAAPTQATIWSWRLLLVKLLISIRISSNLITFDWFWSPFWSLTSDQHQHQHQYQDSLKSDNFSLIRPGMTATHYLSHGPRLRQEAGTFKSCRWVCSPFAVYFQLCTFNCQISCTAAWRPTAGCLQWFTGAFNPPLRDIVLQNVLFNPLSAKCFLSISYFRSWSTMPSMQINSIIIMQCNRA